MIAMELAVASWFSEFAEAFIRQLVEKFQIGDIGEEINHGILQWQHTFFDVGSIPVVLTDAIIVTWIAVIIMIILFRFMVGKETIRPHGKQTVVWLLTSLIIKTAMEFGMNKEEAEKVLPMVGTFGIVIGGCNIISFLKISPPAKNIAFPAAMAIIAIIFVIGSSIRFIGFKGFWVYLTHPMAGLLPFKLLDFVIKPMSLALRLFGNVFGAFVFMEFLSIVAPIIIPGLFGLWFDLADGILQAIIFAYLTMSYIGEIVEVGHEYKEHPEHFVKPKKEKKKKQSEAVPA